MTKLFQRLLAGVLASAVVTGGTMAYTARQPIDGASIFDLDDLAAQLPRDTRYYRTIMRLNIAVLDEDVPRDSAEAWSETTSFDAYDAQGNRIASLSEPDGRLMVGLYEYDAQGNYVYRIMYLDHDALSETRMSFDEQGRGISTVHLSQGELSGTSETTYIPQTDGTTRAELVSFDEKGRERSTETNVLDSRNRIIHREIPMSLGVTYVDYSYDEKDRLIHSVVTSDDERESENFFTYTDAPDGSYTCRYERYENGNLASRAKQQFDAFGVCIHQIEYNAVGELTYEMTAEPLDL